MSEGALLAIRASGWIAALALLGALAATPLGHLQKRALAARRPLGIVASIGASMHGVVALGVYLEGSWWEAIPSVAWLRSGALALALLVPLLITSFPAAVRRFGVRLWKPLHRLAYVSSALVVHHLLLAPFVPRAWALSFAIVLVILGLARLVPWRRDRTVVDR